MSTYPKRMAKPNQRATRKKSQSAMHMSKPNNLQHHFLKGNVGEIYTSSCKCTGVIKAIAPNGNFGLTCVRTVRYDSPSETYEIDEEKVIPLSDIKKIILRNIDPSECQKEQRPQENPSADSHLASPDDPDTCLEQYFHSVDEAEACSLNSEETFPPEAMFAVNEKRFNVTSSYQASLEGYTMPLDKSDPDFKAKEEYCAKIAQEIEAGGDASAWDTMIDEDVECNEELQFSAVLKEGEPGRDIKSYARVGRRCHRGGQRVPLQRESADVRPSGGPNYSTKAAPSQEQSRSANSDTVRQSTTNQIADSSATAEVAAEEESTQGRPTDGSFPSATAVTDGDESKEPASAPSTKKEEKKKFTLDPNAPEFKPSGMTLPPAEPAVLPQLAPSYSYINSGFSQPIQCAPLSVPAFPVPGQPHIINGNLSPASVPFCLPSSVSYVFPQGLASQIPAVAAIRQPQGAVFPAQQLAVISQQPPVMGTQQATSTTSASKTNARSNVGTCGYTRQRSVEQSGQLPQTVPFQMFPHQPPSGFPFVPPGSHPQLGLQLITPASAALTSPSYSGLSTIANSIPVSQSSGQPILNNQHLPQPLPIQSGQPNSQPPTSLPQSQSQGSQFHPCYQHVVGSVQPQSAQMAAYSAQYAPNQLLGSQPTSVSGAFGFYPQGLIPVPMGPSQLGLTGQGLPQQPGSQVHHPGQQTSALSQQQQLQLSAQQQSAAGLTVPTAQQSQQLLLANQYQAQSNFMAAQQLFSQNPSQLQAVLTMMANPQAMQNSLNPSNLHPQPHPMSLYMPQQPNGTI
ncbi:Ataxin 2-like [Sparganum proliferum]